MPEWWEQDKVSEPNQWWQGDTLSTVSKTAILDQNTEDKRIKQTLDMADANEVSLDVAERGLDDFVNIKKKKDTIGIGLGPLWDEPGDTRTMRERLGYPRPEKTYTINFGSLLKEIPKGLARFLERDIGGTFGGTVYNWLGQFIERGGHAVKEVSYFGQKDKDRIYNPIAESIIATGQNISQYGKEARQWYAYQAATGWEAMDEHLRENDPVSYGAGRLTEGVASSALSVLAMYLSGGVTAVPELLNKSLQINRGLVALSTISAAGGFEHAQNQGENFYWATLHGLADGITEYVMESTFLEGVGKGTSKLVAGAKEGAEEFFTGMLQNTRAGILENEAKGMPAYDASKKAVKAALIQSPWEVAAGFIGGWGVAGGAQLAELYQRSMAKPTPEVAKKPAEIAPEAPRVGPEPRKPAEAIKPPPEAKVEVKPPAVAPKAEVGVKELYTRPHSGGEQFAINREGAAEKYYELTGETFDKKTHVIVERWSPVTKTFDKPHPLTKETVRKWGWTQEALAKPPAIAEGKEAWEPTDKELRAHLEAKATYGAAKAVAWSNYVIQPIAKAKKIRVQAAVEMGKPVPREILEEYKTEKWAQEVLFEEKHAKPFAEAAKTYNEKYKSLIGNRIKDGGFEWELKRFNYAGVPYWSKVVKGKVQKKEFTISGYDQKWAQKALVKPKAKVEKPKDILGGVDPINQIHIALKAAKAVQPITEAQKKATLKARVARAAGALKTNVKKGMPTEEAVFASTGLLKGPLAEYDQVYSSVEDILEPGAKEAAYQMIFNQSELQYFEVLNTTASFKKLLAGSALTPGDVENIERVFGKVFEDITDVRTTRSPLYDRLISFWKAGLLTGIKTSGLNTLANVSHSISETAKDVPAALVDNVASLFTGERALAFTARGVPGGVKEGFVRGWKYLRTGLDARHVGAKLDYKRVNFGSSKFSKAVQAYEEAIFHLLGAEDQPFYYGAKARSIYSQAIAQAMNKGLKGKARIEYVDQTVKFPSDEILEYAVHDAEVAVFQNRTNLGDLAKAIQKVKGGEVIVPFGRTPSAVAMQIVNYSPIGAVREISEQIHAGKFDQRKFSQAFGRSAVGTGALYLGGLLFKAGLMNLDYPDNEKERELWKLEGRSANSILIDDKWRTIQTLGPVGNVLIIGGHFKKALKEEGSPTRAIVTALAGGAKSFSEQTFVRGVNLAVDALSAPERSFENWFSSMAGSAVPTIVADIARAQDEKGRWAKGPVERVKARLPILRKGLEPSTDVFGQDLPRYGGNVLETMADPTRPSKVRQDVVVDELRRLFDKDIKVSPTKLGDKAGYDILTKEENTRLWRRAGELTYKGLLALVNSENYESTNDFAKGQLIEYITGQAKNAAKAEMVSIKLGQGKTIMELAESGLFTIESLEMLKYFKESVEGAKE